MKTIWFLLALVLCAVPAFSQDNSRATPATQSVSDVVASPSVARAALDDLASSDPVRKKRGQKVKIAGAIAADLNSGDPARKKEAILILQDHTVVTPSLALYSLEWEWLDPLLGMKEYDLALKISQRGMQANISAPGMLGSLIKCQSKTLMAEGKYEEALSLAKSYYNVCKLEDTRDAIRLISEILVNSRGKTEPDIVKRFRDQQKALAQAPATSDGPPVTLPPELGENILAGVKVDPAPYKDMIEKSAKGPISYNSLTVQGNLLLASDQAKEAQKVFETASDLATDKQLPDAITNIARAIRAQDSGVGRANAYILSLRQAKPANTKSK